MAIRIARTGFPVLSESADKEDFCCWLELEQDSDFSKNTIRLKTSEDELIPLDPDHPFLYETVDSILARLQKDRISPHTRLTLHIDVEQDVEASPKSGFPQLGIKPASAAAALEVAAETRSLSYSTNYDDWSMLISACTDSRSNLLPLNDPEAVERKVALCRREKTTFILLHSSDIRNLEGHDRETGNGKDLSSPESLEKALQEGRFIFPIPEQHGKFVRHGEETGERWSRGLAELMNFALRPLYEIAPEPAPSVADTACENADKHTPAAFFLMAAADCEEIRKEILQGGEQTELFRSALPENSLGRADALPDREQLFLDSMQDDRLLPNVIITGPTGSGKTLLAQGLMVNTLISGRKALYIGPTRALVEEVFQKLKRLLPGHDVILSTGEESEQDWRFGAACFDIACIVNEKANVILSMNHHMLTKLGMVVLDEVHMLGSEQRGGPLDMLLAKLKTCQNDDAPFLRIAAVTTELVEDRKDVPSLDSYLSRTLDDKELPAMTVSGRSRPQKVCHVALLYGRTSTPTEVPLVEFSTQSDRMLSFEHCSTLLNHLKAQAKKFKDDNAHQPQSIHTIAQWIDDRSKDRKRLLVVGNSKNKLVNLANELFDLRRHGLCDPSQNKEDGNSKAAEDIHICCTNYDIPGDYGKKRMEWAEFGVYMHDSDMPRALRQVTEKLFKNDAACSLTPVAFCTETLSYGVNLHADELMLLDLEFPREKHGGEELRPLTENEYHNILGRIGRFKTSNKSPEACIMIDCCTKTSHLDKLVSYYREQSPLRSMALKKEDLRKLSDDMLDELDDISFESFRTVMDALRMAEQRRKSPVRAKEVFNVLRSTFFFHNIKNNEEQKKRLLNFVEKVLDLACNMTFEPDLRLAKKDSSVNGKDVYSLLEQGEALIDTGMSWESVNPMAHWIAKLNAVLKKNQLREAPAELLLPAFLSCREVLKSMLSCLKEFQKIHIGKDRADAWKEERRKDFRSAMARVLSSQGADVRNAVTEDLVTAISSFVQEEGRSIQTEIKSELNLSNDQTDYLAEPFFLSALLITLCWLEGRHNDITKYTKDTIRNLSKTSLHVSAQKIERMSWAAQMCSRFFPASSEYFPEGTSLSPALAAQLPSLAVRLRKGVPLSALPFTYGGLLSPKQIRRLRKNNVTPEEILERASYPGDIKESDYPPFSQLQYAVGRFYKEQYSLLQHKLVGDGKQDLAELLWPLLLKKSSPTKDSCQKLAEICGCLNRQDCPDIDQALLVNAYGLNVLLCPPLLTENKNGYDVRCFIPMHPLGYSTKRGPVFTPGGLFAFCRLGSRLKSRAWETLLEEGKEHVLSSSVVLRWAGFTQHVDISIDVLAVMEPYGC